MGRGTRENGPSVVALRGAAAPPATGAFSSMSAAVAGDPLRALRERPYQSLTVEQLDLELLEANYYGRDRRLANEIQRELWRRPGGTGFRRGQMVGELRVHAIDADRLRIIVALPDDGGLRSMTQTQLLALLSGESRKYPDTPDKTPPAEPFDYGQYDDAQNKTPEQLAHEPIDGRPESRRLAADALRLDQQRDHLSAIRQQTDIVEFERLYWQQLQESAALARRVEAAGGLDPDQGLWGARYISGPAGYLEAEALEKQRIYEQIDAMRRDGARDEEIILHLEDVYASPFGGPRPGAE